MSAVTCWAVIRRRGSTSHPHTVPSPAKFQEWAQSVGPAALAVVQLQFVDKPHTLIGVRACAALRGLARMYGAERFEAACRRAQEIGSLTVKSVRSILQRGLDTQDRGDQEVPPNLPMHQNIRGRDYYTIGR